MSITRKLVTLALCLVSGSAFAQANCYQWRTSYSASGAPAFDSGHLPSADAARAALISFCQARPMATGTGACHTSCNNATATQCDYAAEGTIQYSTFPAVLSAVGSRITVTYTVNGVQGTGTVSPTWNNRLNPEGCPICPEAGTGWNLLPSENALIPANVGEVCIEECGYDYLPGVLTVTGGDISGGQRSLARIRATGRACGQTADAPEPVDATTEDCFADDNGMILCADNSSRCGSYNADRVCVGQQTQGCTAYASGGVACVVDSTNNTTPGAPDNGTAGQEATPNMSVSGSGQTINYYNQNTVNNSTTSVTTTPATGGGPLGSQNGDGGSCDPETETCGPGDGSVSGGQQCDAPPVCTGDALQCAAIDQQWRTRCVDSPTNETLQAEFGESITDSPATGEGGWFPTYNFEVTDTLQPAGWISNDCPQDIEIVLGGDLPTVTIPISEWCEWLSIFGVMIMISSYLAGVRIIMGGL